MARTTIWTAVGLMAVVAAAPAVAADQARTDTWLAATAVAAAQTPAPAPKPVEWEKPGLWKATSFTLEYTLVSDYVWRGLNLSEYPREGREKLNHQFLWGFEIDPAEWGAPNIGRFGGSIWFEWYAGQEHLTDWSSRNHQEVDYTLYWAYDLGETGLGVELGWIAYHLPRLRDGDSPVPGDFAYTHEAYVTLSYDDSKLFGQPLLNPTVSYYQDLDDVQAGFLIFGVSHEFELGKCFPNTPILKDLAVCPSMALGIDHRYYDKVGAGSRGHSGGVGTRLGYLEYGVTVCYDLSSGLGIPPQIGALTLAGFLNYVQPFHDSSPGVKDVLYGGMKLGWEW